MNPRGVLLEKYGTVAIVGVGLIGGSVGMALRARGLVERVVGIGRDPSRLDEARRLGAIDEATTDPRSGVCRADVVVVCTPVDRIAADAIAAAEASPPSCLVTDAGSTKMEIVAEVDRLEVARAKFCGAHPIAGSERQGAAFASADLFEGRPCVLTPSDHTPPAVFERSLAFWEGLGCKATRLSPARHDHALALTSHLPHVVASALSGCVGPELRHLSGGAYRDGTRVADSDGALWAEIFLANRYRVIQAVDSFQSKLATFRRLLDEEDGPSIRSWWEASRPSADPDASARLLDSIPGEDDD